jgi:hypothetical protein
MSCFLLPKSLCDRIEQTICKFWWGSTENHQKVHWKARKDIFKSKMAGGLGFRDMHLFNKAMLAKQVWRLQSDPTSLLSNASRLSIILILTFFRLNRAGTPAMRGKAYFRLLIPLRKAAVGK